MIKRAIIVLALVVTVVLPFALRPKQPALAAADDTLVIITPHNEATRFEFGRGFQAWYRARTGRSVTVDWRVLGGTSDITRYLEGAYSAAFERRWTKQPGRTWTTEIQNGFANPKLPADASERVRAARAEFLASDTGCGLDLFFGGGSYDFVRQAQAGRIVPSRVRQTHPEWFRDAVIPRTFTGESYWDDEGCWAGNVLSNFGIIYNPDALARLGLNPPREWADLTDHRYLGQIALADPTKSSSMAKAFENIIQQQMQRKMVATRAATGAEVTAKGVSDGWLEGLKVIQLIAANARYFTDSSQKPVIDVAQGDCAAGVCIDFYGRAEAEAVTKRGVRQLGFVAPRGGTVNSVDPIAVLRGAPHREVAELFVEFTLSLDGQKLLAFRPGEPGGPERFALRRLPVRRDFYARGEWKVSRSDPEADPFLDPEPLIYHSEWTGHLFRELAFVTHVMCLDRQDELADAWRAIQAAPEPSKTHALEELQDLAEVTYDQVNTRIRRTLGSKDRVEELKLAKELGASFRARYARAGAIARGN
jgi:ABC-type Fe3+ transport system substrate-binding protein